MKENTGKTKVMISNRVGQEVHIILGEGIRPKETSEFKYLESVISEEGTEKTS